MNDSHKCCGNCNFWKHDPGIRATVNASGPIARDAQLEVRGGFCHEKPPQIYLVPVQTIQGAGITPQFFRPVTVETDLPCSGFEPRMKIYSD